MWLSNKHIRLTIAVVVCILVIVCIIIFMPSAPSRNSAKMKEYVEKHEASLMELATRYPNQSKDVNGTLGVRSLDTRNGNACFIFPWSYDILEGYSYLYYAADGILKIPGYTFSDSAYIDGLGINGQGYIECTMLKQNWFFVEAYIPT